MKLIDTPERGSQDFDPEMDYPSLSDQMDAYYDWVDDQIKREREDNWNERS